ncbi:MAG: hypothetical protein JXB49_11075 [Bacteroidales bacterium]|nr:hypothetical protein [Bacteroidales bacterium]
MRRKRGARILWRRVFKESFYLHPELQVPAEQNIENSYKLYWKFFGQRVNLSTLRISKNISGISNPKLIPEEIFFADIEPTLNPSVEVNYLAIKSFYNRWFTNGIFPRDFFHNLDGEWLDQNLNTISFHEVKKIAEQLVYPVVFKPTKDSHGGMGIHFPRNSVELLEIAKSKTNFLVQEKIRQHVFFNQYNIHGLNTVRVYVYRSVTDNNLYIINMALRMGIGGSLDNVTSGGIYTLINQDGFLNGFAVDIYGKKYNRHPDSGMAFNSQIPSFDSLKEISLKVAQKIFYIRVVGLDLCYDVESTWRLIEINTSSSSICFAQNHGVLFFGKFTDEVHDYCIKNHWSLK